MNRRLPGRRRLVVLVASVVLIAAGCAPSGNPETFEDQPGRVGAEVAAAVPDIEPETMLPLAQRNFLEGCVSGDAPRIEGADLAQRGPACQCSFEAIESFYIDRAQADALEEATAEDISRAAFDLYDELAGDLEDPVKPLPADIQTLVDDCFF